MNLTNNFDFQPDEFIQRAAQHACETKPSSSGRDSYPQPPDCKSGTLPHSQLHTMTWIWRSRHFWSRISQKRTKFSISLPSLWVGKWVPAAAGKAKAGMSHSDCGWNWTQDVQVKLCYPLPMRAIAAIPERLRDVSCGGAMQINYLYL